MIKWSHVGFPSPNLPSRSCSSFHGALHAPGMVPVAHNASQMLLAPHDAPEVPPTMTTVGPRSPTHCGHHEPINTPPGESSNWS